MKKSKVVIFGVMVIAIFIITFCIITSTVAASGYDQKREKLVTSVLIEEGDSLWSIADEYYTNECKSIKKYINEIKRSNGIFSDEIYAGQCIIVPYYQ